MPAGVTSNITMTPPFLYSEHLEENQSINALCKSRTFLDDFQKREKEEEDLLA